VQKFSKNLGATAKFYWPQVLRASWHLGILHHCSLKNFRRVVTVNDMIRDSTVGGLDVMEFYFRQKQMMFFLFSGMSRSALRPTLVNGYRQPFPHGYRGRGVKLTNAEIKHEGNSISTPLICLSSTQTENCPRKFEPTCGHVIWMLLFTDRQMHAAK
jgi:hypothetical protein